MWPDLASQFHYDDNPIRCRVDDLRDANRLDYFCVSPFDVYGDDDLGGISGDGGGGDRAIQASRGISYDDSNGRDINVRRNQHLVQRMEQGSASAAPGSFPVRSFATNVGFDSIGPTLNQEMLSQYGASDAPTQQVPFGTFSSNSHNGGGEAVVKRLEEVRECADGYGSERRIDGEGEEGDGFLLLRWWTKCWLLWALWKIAT